MRSAVPDTLQHAHDLVAGRGLRVILPEGEDQRILAAARRLIDAHGVAVMVIGTAAGVGEAARSAGISMTGIERVDAATDPRGEAFAEALAAARPSLKPAMAVRLVQKPLYFAGAAVAQGAAHAMVAGAANPTRRVIEAALMTVGLAPGIETPSSYFLMRCPHAPGGERTVLFADCAVNADPSASELADIAIASAASARRILGRAPRVALVSFSTHGSAAHPRIEKVTAALSEVRRRAPDIIVDGELQVDAALSPQVAAKKVKGESAVAGRADVLVFPDLDSGNIAYKAVQYLGGAVATGPFLQGFARPVSDLSRGASVDDIVATCLMLLAGTVAAEGVGG
jgi:phosphate acetyltransferase